MSQVIRYQVKPEFAAENEQLIRDVFQELHRANPSGFSYQSFVQDDGTSFIHVVNDTSGGESSPLLALEAFQRFQAGIADRCDVGPARVGLREIGSFAQPGSSDA